VLASIQGVTERFAASASLETTVRAAVEGVAGVTGASGVAVVLGPEGLGVTRGLGLDDELERDALGRDEEARRRAREGDVGVRVERLERSAGGVLYALTAPVVWAGEPQGSLTAYLPAAPGRAQAGVVLDRRHAVLRRGGGHEAPHARRDDAG